MAILKGKIIDLREDGTAIIQASVPLETVIHQEVKEVYIELIDDRQLSQQQRKMVYALITAIAEFAGENVERQKQQLKIDFLADRVNSISTSLFSLSNASMSLIADFQRYLIDLIIDYGIPVKRPLIEYVNDIEAYVYSCLLHKKCCISGKSIVDLHHFGDDKIGMGNDRNEVHHLGRKALPLSREYHNEIHTIGDSEFIKKYHLCEGIELDKTLCKLYRLKP